MANGGDITGITITIVVLIIVAILGAALGLCETGGRK
jgi:hypothetical protein